MQRQFLGRRAQMAIVGVGLWLLLALWSLSAFWHHIDALNESYRLAAKCGAMAGEFALLALVCWHCFDKHLGVRRWALIFAFALAAVILIHAGALRGANEARTNRIAAENRLAEHLTRMSNEQSAGLAGSSADGAATSRRERIALANSTKAQQGAIAKAAQEKVAAEIVATDNKVKDASILPRWYLDGWMYSVIFILSLALVGVVFLLMMNQDDIDANFDGIPDRLQREVFPSELDVRIKNAPNESRLVRTQKSDIGRLSPVSAVSIDRRAARNALLEHLKEIAFYCPGRWFKADLSASGVTIRMYKKEHGVEVLVASTTQSDKLLAAVDRPDFSEHLVEELIYQGFPIERERR